VNNPLSQLPPLLVVADSAATAGRPLVRVVKEAVAGGARAVWLRDKGAEPARRRQLASALASLLHQVGGILLASPGPGAEAADGTHLGASVPWLGEGPVGRSCHDLSDVRRAARQGCAWATLSPIFTSAAKPGYGPALGLGALRQAALEQPELAVWALGGVDEANAASCLDAGASGVAVMSAVLAAPAPAAAVAAILARLQRAAV
jgi:thiamine-phosphate pyrophosphorylase